MKFKLFSRVCVVLIGSLLALSAEPAIAFVHISKLKPHLPLSPAQPRLTFLWNGDAPQLKDKNDVLDGAYAESSDGELMAALLQAAMDQWTSVESSYLEFAMEVNPGVVADSEDEIFAIVVEDQASQSVAAAALPMFQSADPGDSVNKNSSRIIYDCDISVSSSSVSAKSLLKTLTHELGHCVGLGHPHSNYHSIMSYANSSDSAALGIDDKAGLSFLYPDPAVSQDVNYLTSCGTTAGAGRMGVWVLLLPLLFLFKRHIQKGAKKFIDE